MDTKDTLSLDLDITPLTPARAQSLHISAETEVLCINRGVDVLEDMFDSVPYKIAPGFFTVSYAGARHFQGRQIVPGSRNPELRTVESFIGVIGLVKIAKDHIEVLRRVDPAEKCVPFTADECRRFALKVEGIDREALVMPISHGHDLIGVNEVRVQMAGAGATVSRGGDRIITGDASAVPASEHAGIQGAAQDAAGRVAEEAAERAAAATPAPAGKRKGAQG